MLPKKQRKKLAYIIGVAIGDGNLSNPNGRAVRLRITCDTKYQKNLTKICQVIKNLLPNNRVSVVKRFKTYCDISCYSNKWKEWLPWKSGQGPKFLQMVNIPAWIKNNKIYSKECLRGLFETDGSLYTDRIYPMVNFVTIIPPLAKDVMEMLNNLKVIAHVYKINTRTRTRYNIRISKNVKGFIKTIRLKKER